VVGVWKFHVKHLRQVAAIAGATARELVRNPAYAVLVACGAGLVVLTPAFAFFHFGKPVKMYADLGLGTALVAGLLVGVLGASWAVSEEIESLSALAVLAKPVSRAGFLVGKYLGVLAAAAGAVAVIGLVLLFALRALAHDSVAFLAAAAGSVILAIAGAVVLARRRGGPARSFAVAFAAAAAVLLVFFARHGPLGLLGVELDGWSWALLPALLGVMLQVAVLAAVAVALSTRLSVTVNLPIVLALFVLGQIAAQAAEAGGAAALVAFVLPDLGSFQLSDAVAEHLARGEAARGPAVPAGVLLGASAVALLYVAGALAAGIAIFSRRDVD
jgi:hypothetical protein